MSFGLRAPIVAAGISLGISCVPVLAFATSLDECYSAALKQSEIVAGQQELIIQAEERLRQAKGALFPTVSGSATRLWQDHVRNGTGGAFYPALADTVKVNATQPLFRGFREFAALRLSSTLKDAALDARRQAEIQLFKDVAQGFYSVLSLEKDFKNIQVEIGLIEKRVSELRERIRIGRSRVSEALAIESSAASLKAGADLVRGQIQVAREVLAFQTGLPLGISLDEDQSGAVSPLGTLQRYLDRIEERPDVAADRKRVAASEESLSIAKGAHWPDLDLGGNYYFVRPGVLSGSQWDFQLALSLPIYSGGTVQSRVRETASQQSQAELALSRTRRLASQEIRTLFATAQADQIQLNSLVSASELSGRNYTEQSKEYRLGLVTNLEVLQALTAWQVARRALDRAAYTLKYDLVRLEAAAVLKP